MAGTLVVTADSEDDNEAASAAEQSSSGNWLWSTIAVGVGVAGFVLLDEKKRRRVRRSGK